MQYPYRVSQGKVDGHAFWTAKSLVLDGCVGQGENASKAIIELAENEYEWVRAAEAEGIPIPPYGADRDDIDN